LNACQRAGCAVLAAALGLCHAGVAGAEEVDDATRSAARELAQQGKAAFARGDFDKARGDFHRAYTLVPAPTLAVYEGRALVKLGRLVEGEEAFVRALRSPIDKESPGQFREAVQTADSELVALRPRVPRVTIVARGPGAEHPGLRVTVDGMAVKRGLIGVEMPMNPGQHRLTANAPGGPEAEQIFSLAEKDRARVEVEVPAGVEEVPVAPDAPLAAQPPPIEATGAEPAEGRERAGSTQRMVGLVIAGVGVVGLGTGIVTGLMAASKHSEAEEKCQDHVCFEGTEGADALDSFRSLRSISTIGYIVGGLGLAGGAALFFTAPRPAQTAFVRPFVGATGAGVMGAF
jgi:hypothetical protein